VEQGSALSVSKLVIEPFANILWQLKVGGNTQIIMHRGGIRAQTDARHESGVPLCP
jgi:hypothetical protein